MAVVPAARAAGTTRVMVVGDSISQGLEGDFTWRYRLAQHLSGAGQAVDFVGPWTGTFVIPADVSVSAPVHTGAYRPGIGFDSDNLAQWGWQMHQAMSVIEAQTYAADPGYLLVELGFNDLGWFVSDANGLWTDLGTFLRGVDNAAARRGHTIRVVVGTVPQRSPIEGRDDLPVAINAYDAHLRSGLAGLGASYAHLGLALADLAAYNYTTDVYDGLHPNVRGEWVIAGAYANALNAAWSFGGAMGVPGTVDAPLALGAPAALSAAPVTGGLRLNWAHVFGASGYTVFQRNVSAGEAAFTALPLPVGADGWTMNPVPAGEQAQFFVRPVKGTASTGADSPVAAVTVGGSAPGLVPAVTISTVTQNSAQVSWSSAAGADNYAIYQTRIRQYQATRLPWNIAGPTFTAGLLNPGTYYQFSVVPYNGYLAAPATGSTVFRTKGVGVQEVVTMGDSYAAGTGAGSYDNSPTGCDQSAVGWGQQIYGYFVTHSMLACAARTVPLVESEQMPTLAGLPDLGPRLINVVVGGNDIGFAPTLVECLLRDCSGERASIEAQIQALRPRLVTLYQEIKAASPNSDIVVGGYPIILEPPGSGCPTSIFSDAERAMVRDLTVDLNNTITSAAQTAGVISAAGRVQAVFTGHGFCGSDDPTHPDTNTWINGATGDAVGLGSFHPNAAGQIAYTVAFQGAFEAAVK